MKNISAGVQLPIQPVLPIRRNITSYAPVFCTGWYLLDRAITNRGMQFRLLRSYIGYEHNWYHAIYTDTLWIDWSNANYHRGTRRGTLIRRTQ
jgi:hypothetical protein